MKVVALAGGVGGAKLADGLARLLPPDDLTIVVNTGDDFVHYGLNICPDLDTVCYTLAGIANSATGWGRADESWTVLQSLASLGGETWFKLGDRDLGTHLERTRRLRLGEPLSEITRSFCNVWGVAPQVLPMSDDEVLTEVNTEEGWMSFQEYFVRRQFQPRVRGFHFRGVETSHPAPGVLEAIHAASLVIICPSNPWVSIDPILAVPGIRQALISTQPGQRLVLAVSPIIAGQAVKGPAAKMYLELGKVPSSLAVARHYGAQVDGGLLDGFVIDTLDSIQAQSVIDLSIRLLVTETLMKNPLDRSTLAEKILNFAEQF